jgi:5-(carboxyamino)imidazole ribonucleotide mutase
MSKVAIIMGSISDMPVMKEAIDILKGFDIETEVDIVSAHRTPEKLFDFSKNAHTRGISVIIAGAGGAAHLPGMVASMSPLPVIVILLTDGIRFYRSCKCQAAYLSQRLL